MNITKEIARKSLYYLEGNLPDGPTDQAEFEQHKALLKALAATPASSGDTAGAKPEGCALVPVDPTHLMIGAGARAVLAAWEENRNLNSLETVKIAYAAMLGAATPAPSVADAAGAKRREASIAGDKLVRPRIDEIGLSPQYPGIAKESGK